MIAKAIHGKITIKCVNLLRLQLCYRLKFETDIVKLMSLGIMVTQLGAPIKPPYTTVR